MYSSGRRQRVARPGGHYAGKPPAGYRSGGSSPRIRTFHLQRANDRAAGREAGRPGTDVRAALPR